MRSQSADVQKCYREFRCAVLGKVGKGFTKHRCELEPVAAQAGGKTDLWMFRVDVDDEVFVSRHRVHANGVRRRLVGNAQQMSYEESFDAPTFGRINVAVEIQRIANPFPTAVLRNLDS